MLMEDGRAGICECWLQEGVSRKGQSQYICASCGLDVSVVFTRLMHVDEPLADKLVEKGSLRAIDGQA